jgi:hypothetical protein
LHDAAPFYHPAQCFSLPAFGQYAFRPILDGRHPAASSIVGRVLTRHVGLKPDLQRSRYSGGGLSQQVDAAGVDGAATRASCNPTPPNF